MQPTLFSSRARNGLALFVSLVAVCAMVAYVWSPCSAIAAKMVASYKRGPHTLVEGVVKSPNGHPDRRGQVRLVFRDGRGHMIERELVKVNRDGQFYVVAPTPAKSVVLTAYLRPGRTAPHGSRTFTITRGQALTVTVVFHATGAGILPAVFPY